MPASPARWAEVSRILDTVLDLPPEERAPYVAGVCGDDTALYEEVTALLALEDAAEEALGDSLAAYVAPLLAALDPEDPFVGRVIDGYHILEVLGRGGMGVVYKAMNTLLDRTAAVKVINPPLAANKTFVRRFHAEAKALAQIQHPNIVFIYSLRETTLGFYIAMEYIDGETLAARLDTVSSITGREALSIAKQLLGALEYAHGKGVLHRDIKPRNIMLTQQGTVKLMDFGLAKIVEGRDETTVTHTRAGTLYYMSPEQVMGLSQVDHRSDLFSLGMTLYEMLTGRLPFDKGDTRFTILKAITENRFPNLQRFNPAVPRPLAKIVMRALEKDPAKRYQSAGEMLAAIEAFERQMQAERGITPLVHPATPTRRMGWIFAALTVALLLGFGAYMGLPRLFPEKVPERLVVTPDPATTLPGQEVLPATGGTGSEVPAPAEKTNGEATVPAPPQAEAAEETEAVAPTGVLVIASEPSGARLFIDGKPRGTTPATLEEIPAGTYTVTMRLDGHEDYTESIAVAARQTRKVEAALVPLMGTLHIAVSPWGRVYVDGALMNEQVTFMQTIAVPAMRHTVTIEHPDYGRWERTVDVSPDMPHEFVVDFTQRVRVTLIVLDTQDHPIQDSLGRPSIYVDGQLMGIAPRQMNLRVGLHTIEARKEGYVMEGPPLVINLEQDRPEPLAIRLRKIKKE